MQVTSIAASVHDPELYSQLLRPKDCRFMVTGAGTFDAEYRRVDFSHVGMQGGAETLPRIFEGKICDGRDVLTIQLKPGPSMYACGSEIDAATVGILSPSSGEFCLRLSGSTEWGTMSMTRDNWALYGRALAGQEPSFTPFRYAHVPPKAVLERFRRVLRSAIDLASDAPELLAVPEVARGIDSLVMEAAVDCVTAPYEPKPFGGSRQHARVIRQFRALIEETAEGALYLPEVCTALGVSGRTFRQCCHDYFGMGPKQYLRLRRLHLARRALLRSQPGENTVTSIATSFGFWELGRFAVAYHDLFGETPVATLRAPSR